MIIHTEIYGYIMIYTVYIYSGYSYILLSTPGERTMANPSHPPNPPSEPWTNGHPPSQVAGVGPFLSPYWFWVKSGTLKVLDVLGSTKQASKREIQHDETPVSPTCLIKKRQQQFPKRNPGAMWCIYSFRGSLRLRLWLTFSLEVRRTNEGTKTETTNQLTTHPHSEETPAVTFLKKGGFP